MSRHIHLTGEPRADHMTNRCIELEEGLRTLRFSGWRDQVDLCIEYDGEHALSTHCDENGFEFDLVIQDKPASNQFHFRLSSKNLVFWKQYPLTKEEIAEGCHRPDNVVDSYAVYHSRRRNNRRCASGVQVNYQCGKFCHIYRPKAFDAAGRWTWCSLDIDGGLLTVTAPKQFMDDAAYPVRIDPVIGYDSAGGSYQTANRIKTYNNMADDFLYVMPSDGTLLAGYTYCALQDIDNGATNAKMCVWRRYGTTNLDRELSPRIAYSGSVSISSETPGWVSFGLTGTLSDGEQYGPGVTFNKYFSSEVDIYYDDPAPPTNRDGQLPGQSCTSGATTCIPDPLGVTGVAVHIWSIYAEYELPPSVTDMNPVTILVSPQTITETLGNGLSDAGNLFAPVNASVHLNTNYSMLYSGTHEPKYALDNDLNTYWRPSSTLNHSLYLKFDEAQLVDAFAFWIHNYNEGFGGDKKWQLAYSVDGFEYRTFGNKPFSESRNAGVPLVAFKFETPVTARYWILSLVSFGDPGENPEALPVGPIMEIGGVWLMRDYSLPYDNQYPESGRFEWGNDAAIARSGSGYQERRFRGHVKISDKEYVFVQQAHSDLLLNAFKASKGGLLPIAFKSDYDSIDWILCRFTSDHSLQETWSEVFQPKMEVREVGFKRIPYTTKTLPALSTTVGHWKFGESLADSSDNGHTLSVVDIPGGAVYDYGVCDHVKTCIVLEEDGLLEVAEIDADALDMGISNFSLELIFATAPVSETTYLLRKIGDNPSPTPSPAPSPSPVAAGYSVSLTTEGKIDVCLGDGLTEVQGSGYGVDLDDRSFHYLAVTVDRTLDLLKVYVDGVQVGSSLDISVITGSIRNNIEPFQLGGENLLSDPKCLIGLLDEVCVSKQLLTAALIASRHAGYAHDGSWRL